MDNILTSRGFNVSQMDESLKLDTIVDLKNKTLGKKAIGTFVTGTVLSGLVTGKLNITGDGLYDYYCWSCKARVRKDSWSWFG
jgi:hypothetical protein